MTFKLLLTFKNVFVKPSDKNYRVTLENAILEKHKIFWKAFLNRRFYNRAKMLISDNKN